MRQVAGRNTAAVVFVAFGLLMMPAALAQAHTDVTREQAKDLIESANPPTVVDVREVQEYC